MKEVAALRRGMPVIALVLLAPVVAELLGGATQIGSIGFLVFFVPMYGAGALLVRELVRRRGLGWPSILALGTAYGIVEEGLALQSLFNPAAYGGVAGWGGRVLEVNGVYGELNVVLHAVWSVAVPILLVDLLFPGRRTRPYVGRLGLGVTVLAYLLGVLLVRVSAQAQSGYVAPVPALGGAPLAAAALVVVGLAWPRTGAAPAPPASRAPSPWAAFAVGAAGTLLFIGPLLLLGRARLPFMQGPLVALPMLGGLLVVAVVIESLRRWSRGAGFGDPHLAALASGAVVAHTLIGDVAFSRSRADALGRAALGVVATAMLAWLAAHVRHRTAGERRHDAARPAPRPFPASMAWMLDNPLARAGARRLVHRLPVEPGMRVVDVGCGPGRLTLPVARAVGDGGEVLAMDLQPEMLDIVERRAARSGLHNVRTMRSAAGDGAIPAGGYDLALLAAVLGEIPVERRPAAMREIATALRPGGHLAVLEGMFDPHRQSPAAVLELAEPAGLRAERVDAGHLVSVLHFRKPGP